MLKFLKNFLLVNIQKKYGVKQENDTIKEYLSVKLKHYETCSFGIGNYSLDRKLWHK